MQRFISGPDFLKHAFNIRTISAYFYYSIAMYRKSSSEFMFQAEIYEKPIFSSYPLQLPQDKFFP